MKRNIFIVSCLCLLILAYACKKEEPCYGCMPRSAMYKFRGDYADKVCVQMNKERTAIVGYPSADGTGGDNRRAPIAYANGYYWDIGSNSGTYSAYLSITREEFQTLYYTMPVDSYKYYLLDKDPYLEYYYKRDTCYVPSDSTYINPICIDCYLPDTAFLNNLIRNNKLESCFERVK